MCKFTHDPSPASVQAVLQRAAAEQQLQQEQTRSVLALVSSLLSQVGPEGLHLSPVEIAGLQTVLDMTLYDQGK